MCQREELSDGGWFCFGGSRFREAEAVEEVGNMAEAVDDEHLQQTNPDSHQFPQSTSSSKIKHY